MPKLRFLDISVNVNEHELFPLSFSDVLDVVLYNSINSQVHRNVLLNDSIIVKIKHQDVTKSREMAIITNSTGLSDVWKIK